MHPAFESLPVLHTGLQPLRNLAKMVPPSAFAQRVCIVRLLAAVQWSLTFL